MWSLCASRAGQGVCVFPSSGLGSALVLGVEHPWGFGTYGLCLQCLIIPLDGSIGELEPDESGSEAGLLLPEGSCQPSVSYVTPLSILEGRNRLGPVSATEISETVSLERDALPCHVDTGLQPLFTKPAPPWERHSLDSSAAAPSQSLSGMG